jgi:hypothetical protein
MHFSNPFLVSEFAKRRVRDENQVFQGVPRAKFSDTNNQNQLLQVRAHVVELLPPSIRLTVSTESEMHEGKMDGKGEPSDVLQPWVGALESFLYAM